MMLETWFRNLMSRVEWNWERRYAIAERLEYCVIMLLDMGMFWDKEGTVER